jgi:ceramide glucosyltransferase
MILYVIATICLIWYTVVALVCAIGIIQLYVSEDPHLPAADADSICRIRWYSSPPKQSISVSKGKLAPHVTIIRPCKGVDVEVYQTLASTFHQTYHPSRLTVCFCVDSPNDPVVPVLRQLVADYSSFDAKIFFEAEDPHLHGENATPLGPNPKIRSMSRAYREVKDDVVWIIDCNVWVNKGTCGRMVDRLCGFDGNPPNKFVHQLPIVVDRSSQPPSLRSSGGHFEEAWFSGAHAKFYTAINTVLLAPCIVGKSNMFRRSNLDGLTGGQGINYFSYNICEDHLIGDLLWKSSIPHDALNSAERMVPGAGRPNWGNHALDFGDLAIQPVANMTVREFFSRRVRWLRVRKFTVILATLVEPGTESILCSIYGAFAVTTLPWLYEPLGIPPTWRSFAWIWLLSITTWATIDFALYRFFETGLSIEHDENTPPFAQFAQSQRFQRRPFSAWLLAWIGRELLAFPIWTWAVYGGVTVSWRGRKFRVGTDMRVREVTTTPTPSLTNSKSRLA